MSHDSHVSHRPWQLPHKHHLMSQTWHDLLFANWPVQENQILKLIPPELTLDTYDHQAWISIVPFWMSHIHLRGLPAIPFFSKFSELNLRTYVKLNDKPGVFFFSLDANHRIAVEIARFFFHLPYFHADIHFNRQNKNTVHYHSIRYDHRVPKAEFLASYEPISEPFFAPTGSLAHWLTERYCLYCNHQDKIYRAEIAHQPWTLQHAKVDITTNTLAKSFQIELPNGIPTQYFSKKLDVLIWPLERIY